MKKFIIALSLIAVTAFYVGTSSRACLYPLSLEVVAVDKDSDTFTLIDNSGYTWTKKGIEDWQTGDKAAAIIDNMDTVTRADDKILTLHYQGR